MARETVIKLLDDLDGGRADETVEFGLDGHRYQIDLSSRNANALRASLAPFMAAGVKVPRNALGSNGRVATTTMREQHEQNQKVRVWAEAMGLDVAPRGRIKQEILDQYHAAGGALPSEAPEPAPTAASAKAVKKAGSKRAAQGGARGIANTEREPVAARGGRRPRAAA